MPERAASWMLSVKQSNTAGKCGPCQRALVLGSRDTSAPLLRAEGGMGHHGRLPLDVLVSSTASDGTEVWGHLPAPLLNNWKLILITLIIHHIDCYWVWNLNIKGQPQN